MAPGGGEVIGGFFTMQTWGMRTVPLRRMSCWAAILLLGLLATGCGDGKVGVRGTVTFDGQPVQSGVISFEPADGRGPNTGGAITDGRFELSGPAEATPGLKIVRIRASRPTGRKIESGPPAPPGTLVDELKAYIPSQYNAKSTLTTEIVAGKVNEVSFDLQSSRTAPR
jgi:hypothetical protein